MPSASSRGTINGCHWRPFTRLILECVEVADNTPTNVTLAGSHEERALTWEHMAAEPAQAARTIRSGLDLVPSEV